MLLPILSNSRRGCLFTPKIFDVCGGFLPHNFDKACDPEAPVEHIRGRMADVPSRAASTSYFPAILLK